MMEQLEQLYYTWSQIGLGGVTGLRVRAASTGVADIEGARYRSFEPYLGYALPQGSDSSRATKENSPYCLAFVDTEKEHIALQKVFTGKDAYGRPGVYFVHLLASLPEKPPKPDPQQVRKKYPKDYTDLDAINFWGFTARDAIDMWMSGFWQTSVPDTSPVTLPSVPLDQFERLKGRLSEKDMPEISNDLKFVIAAFLSLEPHQKLYIAAPPQLVAALIWGLAHSLPRTLQVGEEQHLTFSTYEQDVTRASMRVIGTCRSTEEVQHSSIRLQPLLPPECFNGQGLALDCYTNNPSSRYSPLSPGPEITAYAEYAVERLIHEEKRELDAFLKQVDRMRIDTKKSFITAFSIEKYLREMGELNEDLVLGLFESEELAMVWLPNEKVPPSIIKLAAENPPWWQEKVGPPLKKLLRTAAFDTALKDVFASFAEGIANVICDAMLANQETLARPALKMLQTLADPKVDFAPWLHLLHRFSARIAKEPRLDPGNIFSPETRFYFLALWAVGVDAVEEQDIRPWLPARWSEFEAFVSSRQKFPPRWATLAVYDLLRNSSEALPPFSKELMKKHGAVFEDALTILMLSRQTQGAALRFYTVLVNGGYKERLSLLSTLLNVKGEPTDLHSFLFAARLTSKEEQPFLEQNSRALAQHSLSGATPMLQKMMKAYLEKLAKLPWRDLENTTIFKTLWYLRQIPLPKDLRLPKDKEPLGVRIRQYSDMSLSLRLCSTGNSEDITIEKTSLQEMGEAIWCFGAHTDEEFLKTFFFLLVKHPRDSQALRCIVESLAPYFVEATEQEAYRDFLSRLAMSLGKSYSRKYPYSWLMPYIELAFKYTTRLSDEGKRSYLEPFLEGLLKNADDLIFDSVEREITLNRQFEKYIETWNACRPHRQKGGGLLKMFSSGSAQPRTIPSSTETRGAQSEQASPPSSRDRDMRPLDPPQQPGSPQPYSNRNMGQPSLPPSSVPYGHTQQNKVSDSAVEARPSHHLPANEPVARPPSDEPRLPSSQAAPQTVITEVNGISITREWLEMVFALKDVYIAHRLKQLRRLSEEQSQKKGNGNEPWIFEELDELQYHSDRTYTLKVLQDDILIQHGIAEYSRLTPGTMSNIGQLVLDVHVEVKKDKGAYNRALAGKYNEKDVQEVLSVFARYRILAEYFVKQSMSISMKEWLQQQRFSANVMPPQFLPITKM